VAHSKHDKKLATFNAKSATAYLPSDLDVTGGKGKGKVPVIFLTNHHAMKA
jgi:hypothetical protein